MKLTLAALALISLCACRENTPSPLPPANSADPVLAAIVQSRKEPVEIPPVVVTLHNGGGLRLDSFSQEDGDLVVLGTAIATNDAADYHEVNCIGKDGRGIIVSEGMDNAIRQSIGETYKYRIDGLSHDPSLVRIDCKGYQP